MAPNEELRTMLRRATSPPPLGDPVPAVRRRISRRRRARLAAAGTTLGLAGVVSAVILTGGSPPLRIEPGPPAAGVSTGKATVTDDQKNAGPPITLSPAEEADPDNPPGITRLGHLVGDNPDTFVGLYRDGATGVVVFGAGADQAAWRTRLQTAAGTSGWRAATCPVSAQTLRTAQADLQRFTWPEAPEPWSASVDARRCAVVVRTGAMADANRQALEREFGPLVVVKTGNAVGRSPRR